MSVDEKNKMKYSVAQLLKEHSGAVRSYDVSENISHLDPEIHPLEPLTGQIMFLRTPDGIMVTGDLHTALLQECSRCLEQAIVPIDFDLEETFTQTVDVFTGHSLPIPTDVDAATLIDEHHILDLTEAVRQGILLSKPAQPLCRADCLGICPICGQNRNENLCDCNVFEPDSRWAALENWKD
jgi:uncharacterized protein